MMDVLWLVSDTAEKGKFYGNGLSPFHGEVNLTGLYLLSFDSMLDLGGRRSPERDRSPPSFRHKDELYFCFLDFCLELSLVQSGDSDFMAFPSQAHPKENGVKISANASC